jgi:hypothetical protein
MSQFRISDGITVRAAIAALLGACGAAEAQVFTANFESPAYSGSSTGTLTTGQQGWYLPPVASSVDHNIYTYAGNSLGIVANPSGGAQFDAGRGVSAAANARAQHAMDFSAGGVWQASWDCTGKYAGTTFPAADNIGSWSLQTSTSRYFQQLMSWGSNAYSGPFSPPTNWTATADHFHIHWGVFTVAPYTSITFVVPSQAWLDLPIDHWYHVSVKWDFNAASPQLLQVSIKDLTTNGPTTTDDVSALGWYLQGGPNSTFPLPTDMRVFAGSTDDVSAWDNLVVGPFVGGCYANCDGSTTPPVANVADFTCFLQKFAANDAYANCDGSTTPPTINVADFTCFLQKFAAGCP